MAAEYVVPGFAGRVKFTKTRSPQVKTVRSRAVFSAARASGDAGTAGGRNFLPP